MPNVNKREQFDEAIKWIFKIGGAYIEFFVVKRGDDEVLKYHTFTDASCRVPNSTITWGTLNENHIDNVLLYAKKDKWKPLEYIRDPGYAVLLKINEMSKRFNDRCLKTAS